MRKLLNEHIEEFYPKDSFSKDMLKSIPIKVKHWLDNMNQDSSGQFGDIKWNFDPDGGSILYGQGCNDNLIQLWWDQDFLTCGNVSEFEDIALNLAFFISIENKIYNEFMIMHDMLKAAKAIRIPVPAGAVITDYLNVIDPLDDTPIILNAEERNRNISSS